MHVGLRVRYFSHDVRTVCERYSGRERTVAPCDMDLGL